MFSFLNRFRRNRWRSLLSPYLDNRLPPAQRQRLEEHLAACEKCREELAELRATVMLLQRFPQEEVPRSFAVIRDMVPASARAPVSYRMMPAGAAVAAVLLALVLTADVSGLLQSSATQRDMAAPQAERAMTTADKAAEPSPQPQAEGAQAPSAPIAPTPTPVPPATATPEQGLVLRPEPASTATEEATPALWRALEIGLAAALVGLVAGSIILWQRRRRAAI